MKIMSKDRNTWVLMLPEEFFREAIRRRFLVAVDVLQEWSAKDLEYQEKFPFKEDLFEKTGMDFFEDELTDLFVMHDYAMQELTEKMKANPNYEIMDDDEKASWLGSSLEKIFNVLLDEFCIYGNKAKYYEIIHSGNMELDDEILDTVIDETHECTMDDALKEESETENSVEIDDEVDHYVGQEKREEVKDEQEEDKGDDNKPRSVRL